MSYANLSPTAAAAQSARMLMIDVRTPGEYESGHIQGAILHPLNAFDAELVRNSLNGKDGCILICRSGGRASRAAEILAHSGISGLAVLEGGMQAWESAGLPVSSATRQLISLERQVRIAAGMLVLAGALLAYFVHPAWIFLSAFVGAGLVFSGITNTCGMALLLARMPWNN